MNHKPYCPTVEDLLLEWNSVSAGELVVDKLSNDPVSISISIDLYLSDREFVEENPDVVNLMMFLQKKYSSNQIYVFDPDELGVDIDTNEYNDEIAAITRGKIYSDESNNVLLDTGYRNIFIWKKKSTDGMSLPVIFAIEGILKKGEKSEFIIQDSTFYKHIE